MPTGKPRGKYKTRGKYDLTLEGAVVKFQNGTLAVASGQLQSIAAQGGRMSYLKNRFSPYGNVHHELSVKGGTIGGRAKSDRKTIACRSNGAKSGAAAVARGVDFKALARLAAATSGAKTRHVRWHVNRGMVNPACDLCRPE